MIDQIEFKNLKIHKHIKLELRNLTLLSGKNSSGKSTVIQGLLLLRQSFKRDNALSRLQLNGDLYESGFSQDVINQVADDDSVEMTIVASEGHLKRRFYKQGESSNQDVLIGDTSYGEGVGLSSLSVFSNDFQYISAFRLPPRDFYPLDSTTVISERQISKERGECEYVAHYLNYYSSPEGRYSVPRELWHPACTSDNLAHQVNAWEGEISSNVTVHSTPYGKGYSLKYSYTQKDGLSTNEYSAVNVGFGLSFVLPIIVAILSAPKGSLVIIENPEAHLHAQGQAALMELIVKAAQYGIQVLIETHSDYILNRVLINVKKGAIKPTSVSMYFFDKDETSQNSVCSEVAIREDGSIDSQPDGFFDQMQKDLGALLGF